MDGIKNNIITPLSKLNLKITNDEIIDSPEINKKKKILLKIKKKKIFKKLLLKVL